MTRGSGSRDELSERRLARKRAAVVRVDASTDGGAALDSWENEGGRHSDGPRDAYLPERLDWQAFSSRCFPGRRRHDLDALMAYEAYRSLARR